MPEPRIEMAVDTSAGEYVVLIHSVTVSDYMFAQLMYLLLIKMAEWSPVSEKTREPVYDGGIKWIRLVDRRGVERSRWDAPKANVAERSDRDS